MRAFIGYTVGHTIIGISLMGWVGTVSPAWALWFAWPFWVLAYLMQLNAPNLNIRLKNGLFLVHMVLPAVLAWILRDNFVWWRTFFLVNAIGMAYDVLSFAITLSRLRLVVRHQQNDEAFNETL